MLIAHRNGMVSSKGGAKYWGLCFTAEEAGATVQMTSTGNAPVVSLEYSIDGNTWQPFVVNTTTITLNNIGDKTWIRAGDSGNQRFAASGYAYNYFVLNKRIAASGNIMSLLNNSTQLDTISYQYCFLYLFKECSSLTHTPELPATTLAGDCYSNIFINCTSLVSGSELKLPATTLTNYCYNSMFHGCTSLTSAPELPATVLANSCYAYMFNNCKSLTSAPELPATVLADKCYQRMFAGCSNLNNIHVRFTSFNPSNATSYWIFGVNSSGTFYCPIALGTNETITRGNNNCPNNWTVINTDAA